MTEPQPAWVAAPYGNAVVNGEPESEWDWCVINPTTDEMVEVESKARAEQIAALLNTENTASEQSFADKHGHEFR